MQVRPGKQALLAPFSLAGYVALDEIFQESIVRTQASLASYYACND